MTLYTSSTSTGTYAIPTTPHGALIATELGPLVVPQNIGADAAPLIGYWIETPKGRAVVPPEARKILQNGSIRADDGFYYHWNGAKWEAAGIGRFLPDPPRAAPPVNVNPFAPSVVPSPPTSGDYAFHGDPTKDEFLNPGLKAAEAVLRPKKFDEMSDEEKKALADRAAAATADLGRV